MGARESNAHIPGQLFTESGGPTTLLEYVRYPHHHVGSAGRLIAKFPADACGKGHVNIEEGECLEDLREHADMLKVDDPDCPSRGGSSPS